MKKSLLTAFVPLVLSALTLSARPTPPKPKPKAPARPEAAVPDSVTQFRAYVDSVNATFHYQTGHIVLPGGVGELTVPHGFQYLDSAQAGRVIHQLWHNPPRTQLGMLFPVDAAPLADKSWGYIIDYDAMGYVKDDDADKIDYDELLENLQKEAEEDNPAREAAGYEAVHVYGWGATPYYDKQQHTLHWAKLLRFGTDLEQTLNYNVRILGRHGVLIFNAVAEPQYLPEIKTSVPSLLANVQFVRGEQYRDFNPGLDEVAAYSIGGLVAGKVLAKVGAFALLAKFWKVIILALGGAWAAVKRFFGFGSKE